MKNKCKNNLKESSFIILRVKITLKKQKIKKTERIKLSVFKKKLKLLKTITKNTIDYNQGFDKLSYLHRQKITHLFEIVELDANKTFSLWFLLL